MSGSGAPAEKALRTLFAAIALACALAPLAQAQVVAVDGRLVATEPADFAAIEGVRIHEWSRKYRLGSSLSDDFGLGWDSALHARILRLPRGGVVVAGSSVGWIEYPAIDEQTRDAQTFLLANEADNRHRGVDRRELRRNLLALTRLAQELRMEEKWAPGSGPWLDPVCKGAGVMQRDQGYVHKPCKGPVEYFDREGRLTEVRHDGSVGGTKRLQIHRDASGALRGVADAAGNRIDFEREGSRVTTARTRHDGKEFVLRYAYDPAGRLTTLTDISATGKERVLRTYAYDEAGRLLKTGDGRQNTTIRYDAQGRVAAIDNAGPYVSGATYRYEGLDDGAIKVRMEWSDGRKTVVQESESDGYGRPVVSYAGDGSRIEHMPRTGLPLTSVDTRGVEKRAAYDSGNRLRMLDSSNGDRLRISYGSDGLPSELRLTAGGKGADGEPTEFGRLLAPASTAVVKLAWKSRDKPTRIAWNGHCIIRFSYGPDGEAIGEPSYNGRQECVKQLGNIYSSLF